MTHDSLGHMREIPLKVWRPLGKPKMVMSIASDIDFIGNMVAEGYIHPSMFWPRLAAVKGQHAKRAEQELRQERKSRAAMEYAESWVGRWIAQIDELRG